MCIRDRYAGDLAFIREMALKSVPTIDFSQNIRNFAGLRAVAGDDFIVEESTVKNFINAAGIKSPGLSSAPAIAEDLVRILSDCGLTLDKKGDFKDERRVVRLSRLPMSDRDALIRKNPAYGLSLIHISLSVPCHAFYTAPLFQDRPAFLWAHRMQPVSVPWRTGCIITAVFPDNYRPAFRCVYAGYLYHFYFRQPAVKSQYTLVTFSLKCFFTFPFVGHGTKTKL